MRFAGAALLSLLALAACPAAGQEFHWIEGEDFASSSFNRHGWYEDTGLSKDLMSPGVPESVDGDWLAHYSSGDPADTAQASWNVTITEAGTYTWWMRCNAYQAVHRWALDRGPYTDVDFTDPRERVNVVDGIDIRWLAWVKVAELDLAPGDHVLSVEVLHSPARGETHGGIDAHCLVDFPWEPTGVLQPGDELNPAEPDQWFVFHPGDDPFSPDSVTDLSDLIEAPAGLHGPLQRVGDRFEYRDRPGVPVKIWGVNTGSILPTEDLQRRQARLWRKYGVNLVRVHPLESVLGLLQPGPMGGRRLDPAALDRFDRWFAVLKSEGILSDWSCFYPHVITPDDGYPPELYAELPDRGAGKSSAGFVTFMDELQDAEWAWLQALLQHVNPYTGLAYAEDPALAIVEVRNEDSVFWHFPLNPLAAGDHPLHLALLQQRWADWLRARYGDDSGLAAAWGAGLRGADSVDNPSMGIYGAWQMHADGPDLGVGVVPAERARMGDWIRFLAETQRAGYERRIAALRTAGFEGVTVTTAWRAGGAAAEAANLWTDAAGDAIDRHSYAGGGAGGHEVVPGPVNAGSHLTDPGSGLVAGHVDGSNGSPTPLFQVEGRPNLLSEWTMSAPAEWKLEGAPLVALHGLGLQGWDGAIHFAASTPRLEGGWPSNARAPSSYVSETPHYFGQFPALARAVHEGHVAEGELYALRRLAQDEVFAGFDALTRDLGREGFPGRTDVAVRLDELAVGPVRTSFEDPPGPSEVLDFADYYDSIDDLYQYVTGAGAWRPGLSMVIGGAGTHAILGFTSAISYDLPFGSVQGTAAPDPLRVPAANLIFTALDGLPLADSEHLLVTAIGRDRPLGAAYSDDGTELLLAGGPPLLLEPVQAEIRFAGGGVISARALDPHGVPKMDAEVQQGFDDLVVIDGRWRTWLYEIRREPAPQRCLARTQADALSPLTPAAATLFLDAPTPEGLTLDAAAPGASVPHACPFDSGDADPEQVLRPGGPPLLFYQVTGDLPGPIRVEKDEAAATVRIRF